MILLLYLFNSLKNKKIYIVYTYGDINRLNDLISKKCEYAYIFFIKELNKYNNKIMGQSNIMEYHMQTAT